MPSVTCVSKRKWRAVEMVQKFCELNCPWFGAAIALLPSLHRYVRTYVLFKAWLRIPYCPEKAPMGARSSSFKIWGWAVTRRTCLNGSTIPMQGPTPDAKSACIIGLSVIRRGQPVEKAVSCYKADQLVRSLVSGKHKHWITWESPTSLSSWEQ